MLNHRFSCLFSSKPLLTDLPAENSEISLLPALVTRLYDTSRGVPRNLNGGGGGRNLKSFVFRPKLSEKQKKMSARLQMHNFPVQSQVKSKKGHHQALGLSFISISHFHHKSFLRLSAVKGAPPPSPGYAPDIQMQ